MSYYGWKPYVPVAERRKKAEKAVSKAKNSGKEMAPVTAFRGALAKTFWGKAWCDNLERYSDYANRLPRGRTYVRNGSVIDLHVGPGTVRAQVMGSSVYKVEVAIRDISDKHWEKIAADCSGSVATLVELLQGKLSKAVMERISRAGDGMFPAPKEINFQCSCPDWATMCKHVAAVLYGIGNRLDQQPELLFTLRGVDAAALIADAGSRLGTTPPAVNKSKVLDSDALADVFGIELAGTPVVKSTAPKKPRQSIASAKSSTRSANNATAKKSVSAIALPKKTGTKTTMPASKKSTAPRNRTQLKEE